MISEGVTIEKMVGVSLFFCEFVIGKLMKPRCQDIGTERGQGFPALVIANNWPNAWGSLSIQSH